MKKKFLICILCLLTLCSCGNDASNNNLNSKTNSYESDINKLGENKKMNQTSEQNTQIDSANRAFALVLQNEKPFYCTDKVPYANLNDIYEYNGYLNQMVYSNDKPFVIPHFTVIDMDGNKIPEIVLEIEDYYGYIILRYVDGSVQGNIVGYRTMNHLKDNGMFISSSSAFEDSWGKMFFVNHTFIKDEKIHRTDTGYYKNDIPISQDAWEESDTTFSNLQDAEWYEYSNESINRWIIKNPLFVDLPAETQTISKERQEYLDSLSYLLDMTYNYTQKNQEELNTSAKEYYNNCIKEMDKIYQLCIGKLSKEKSNKLNENQQAWQENMNQRLAIELSNFHVNSIDDLEDQHLYYIYGDIVFKRIFYLINTYYDFHFYN